MIHIVSYLILFLLAIIGLFISPFYFNFPNWYFQNSLFIKCSYLGGLGGVLYCLRAIYLNKCVQKRWDEDWTIWYYVRPINSAISGFISCIFLKAGLLVLEASTIPNEKTYGYWAIAFIAGYNVDNFLRKIEAIAQTIWGIDQSRSSSITNQTND